VFNSKGEIIYPTSGTSTTISTTPEVKPIETTPQPAVQYSGVKLGSSSKDEKG
jgi:hypothetical protein